MPLVRTALVTGTCFGVGRAIAIRLAADGFNVALNDHNASALEEARRELGIRGYRATIIHGDVSKEDEVREVVAQTVKAFGELNVLVANMTDGGFGGTSANPNDTLAGEFNQPLATNIRGTFLCYQYAAKQMIAQGKGGKIIGGCSFPSQGGEQRLCTHSASRFAVRGMTQVAAAELRQHDIKVNCYSLGPVESPIAYHQSGIPFRIRAKTGVDVAPFGQFGRPEDAVSFLASDASNWMTGQTAGLYSRQLDSCLSVVD